MERFVEAQEKGYSNYERALSEIRRGKKKNHWIWYIFPQLVGLGVSFYSQYYGIKSAEEAREYMEHPILGPRLLEITEALLEVEENDPEIVMDGETDAMKLRSSMTLFSIATPEYEVFDAVLDKYFHGRRDPKTVKMLNVK